MTKLENCFTSDQYMNEASGDRMASCVKCGVLMARMYEEDRYTRSVSTFWCGSCGIVIYKTILGEWKTSQMEKSRLE